MDTCPDCGNHDMSVRVFDGASVHECGLCGAMFGDPRAVERLRSATAAHSAGVNESIYPLTHVLSKLPGLKLGESSGGSVKKYTLPFVELLVTGPEALAQIENLAKALRLMAGTLRCTWSLDVSYERALTFRLTATGSRASLRDARIDLEALAKQIERDMRLTWWRHASDGTNG